MEQMLSFSNIARAKNWLLNSGIQNIAQDEKVRGGFGSWYDPQTKDYPYIFSEITGYALTTLLHLYYQEPSRGLVERCNLAVDWLANWATHPSGGIRTRYFHKGPPKMYTGYDWKNGTLYTFDTGMVLFGVTNLYRTKQKGSYFDYARRLGEFLLMMQKTDGGFYAYCLPQTDEKVDIPDKWSTQSGAYHAKLALGLLRLYDLTGEGRYRDAAIDACEFALKFQRPSGRFVTYCREGDTHLHPHCYACEGLLFAGQILNEPRFVEAARRGTRWSLTGQMESGGIPSMYYRGSKKFGKYERSDVLAQVLRLGALTLGDSYREQLARLKSRLLEFQVESEDSAADGGFRYGSDEDGTEYPHVNSWCTMFALQALRMRAAREKGEDLGLDFLI